MIEYLKMSLFEGAVLAIVLAIPSSLPTDPGSPLAPLNSPVVVRAYSAAGAGEPSPAPTAGPTPYMEGHAADTGPETVSAAWGTVDTDRSRSHQQHQEVARDGGFRLDVSVARDRRNLPRDHHLAPF